MRVSMVCVGVDIKFAQILAITDEHLDHAWF